MKNHKTLMVIFFLASVFMFACKSDNGKEKITGNWQGTHIDMENVLDSIQKQTANEGLKNTTFSFNADGTFNQKMLAKEIGGTWEYISASNALNLTYKGDDEAQKYTVTLITDKNLSIKNADVNATFNFERK